MSATSPASARWFGFLDLVACFAAFALVLWVYGRLEGVDRDSSWGDAWVRYLVVSALVAWLAVVFPGGGWSGGLRNWLDLSFCAVGFNLVVQYGLNYLALLDPTPWPVAVAGGVASVGLIGAIRFLLRGLAGKPPSILLVGWDEVAEALAVPLGDRIAAVLARQASRLPAGLAIAGDPGQFDEVVAAVRPARVIYTEPGWLASVPPRRLLRLQYSNVAVEDGAAVFEDVLQRVCWQRLRPVDMLLASPAAGNHAVKTLQAIYTNLAGLALLLAAAPLLVALAIATAAANGGPALEAVWCSGLQRIPYRMLRFRTRRADGSMSGMGRLLERLRLTNWPQLINVVRGEMGLFGPPPVRREFADRLCQAIPAYPYRFAVKPGILGWSQANLRGGGMPDDALSLGYDLYYAKHESPSFDIEIILRTLVAARGAGGGARGAGGGRPGAGGSATGAGGSATGAGGSATGAGGSATGAGGGARGAGGGATGAGGGARGAGGGARGAGGGATGAGGGARGAGGGATGADGGRPGGGA